MAVRDLGIKGGAWREETREEGVDPSKMNRVDTRKEIFSRQGLDGLQREEKGTWYQI